MHINKFLRKLKLTLLCTRCSFPLGRKSGDIMHIWILWPQRMPRRVVGIHIHIHF